MRDYLKQLVPNDFEDIVSMNALYRPGALGMNMVDSYINRKHGREEVTYGHESVKNTQYYIWSNSLSRTGNADSSGTFRLLSAKQISCEGPWGKRRKKKWKVCGPHL